MAQCAGTTLKGERCKREARENSSYCSIHFERAPRPSPEADASSAGAPGPRDADWMLMAVLGMAAVAAVVFLRLRR